MRTLFVVTLLGFVAVSGVRGQDHDQCPMAQGSAHRARVDHRHAVATGVGDAVSEHHFLLAKDGGSIRLEVKEASQVEARGRIRKHLRTIAESFSVGDFSAPRQIHDQAPPGSETMKDRKAAIRYVYSDTDKGGMVAISTRDAAALAAVHEFLRFQVLDHATGDPTE